MRRNGLRPAELGAGQEAASVPAAPRLGWHAIKRAASGPVKSSSRRGSRLRGDAAGVPGHSRGEKPETPAQQLGHNEEENSHSCIQINVTTTMCFCPSFFFHLLPSHPLPIFSSSFSSSFPLPFTFSIFFSFIHSDFVLSYFICFFVLLILFINLSISLPSLFMYHFSLPHYQ